MYAIFALFWQGLYVFIVYTLLRLPCASCNEQQKALYAINDTQAIQTEHQTPDRPPVTNSVKGSPPAFIEEVSKNLESGILQINVSHLITFTWVRL